MKILNTIDDLRFSFPSSSLGTHVFSEALLRCMFYYLSLKQSFNYNWCPKQELGTQKQESVETMRRIVSRPAKRMNFSYPRSQAGAYPEDSFRGKQKIHWITEIKNPQAF